MTAWAMGVEGRWVESAWAPGSALGSADGAVCCEGGDGGTGVEGDLGRAGTVAGVNWTVTVPAFASRPFEAESAREVAKEEVGTGVSAGVVFEPLVESPATVPVPVAIAVALAAPVSAAMASWSLFRAVPSGVLALAGTMGRPVAGSVVSGGALGVSVLASAVSGLAAGASALGLGFSGGAAGT